MNKRVFLAVAAATALTFAAAPVLAEEAAAKPAPPAIAATQEVKVITTVEAIDLETKMVTLKGPEGNLETIHAANTPNLEMVEVGDQVNVEYVQSVSLELVQDVGEAQPGVGHMSATATNKENEAPGGMDVETTIMTARVVDINIEANTFKLEMPSGEVREFTAQNPENLKIAKVGDFVVSTVTNAVAIYLAEEKPVQ